MDSHTGIWLVYCFRDFGFIVTAVAAAATAVVVAAHVFVVDAISAYLKMHTPTQRPNKEQRLIT